MSAALLIDGENPHTVQVAADLARLGYAVDAIARRPAPILRSRHCRRPIVSPSIRSAEFPSLVDTCVTRGSYDAVYLCSDEVIAPVAALAAARRAWPLPLPRPDVVEVLKSKGAVLDVLRDAGVPTPRTVEPTERTS